ncbi:efflux RND transporter permease subunit [Zhongshania marina]|uniref:RND transporter n=1 Tax=Zhongshania marina TaxID=2304603 RepID=A0A2S4HB47_9GAMM|nr:MMPL family transporter [Marortus luteolus]POP51169.1 RND transporter [Marortus luteolus]RNL65927.1 RND transporter [Zhongshania marina]
MAVTENKFVDRVDAVFGNVADWAVNHRLIVLLLSLLMLGLGTYFAGKVQADNSLDAYFDKSDPVYLSYTEYLDEFLSDEVTYIIYRVPDRPHGPFNYEAMGQIAHLAQAFEDEVPYVRDVISLPTVEFIRADGDSINVDELMLDFPEDQEALLKLREEVLSRPLYVDYIINEKADYAAIILEMERSSVDPLEDIIYDEAKGNQLENLYPQVSDNKLREIMARPEYAGIEFFITGDVPMNSAYNHVFMEDSAIGTLVTLAMLAVLSFLLFRVSLLGLFGPLAVVVLSIVMVLGVMGAFGWVLGLFFGIVPTLLCAVGVAQSVHILLEFQRAYGETGDRKVAVKTAISKVGGACMLASITTAVGFLVMTVSQLKVLSEMALYAASGVMFTFILSMTLLVVALASGKSDTAKVTKKKGPAVQPGILWLVERCISLNLNHPKALLGAGTAILLFFLAGLSLVKVDFNFLEDFKPDVEWRQHTELAESVMGGILNVTYIIDTDEPEGVKNPEILHAIDRIQQFAEAQPLVKKTYSVVDIQKDLNRSFHGDDPAWYRLPDDRNMAAQYFLVYEISGGEELAEFVGQDYSRTVLEMRVEMSGSAEITKLLATIDDYIAENPIPNATVRKTGIGLMWVKMGEYIADTQLIGYSLIFVMVAGFLCVAFGSVKVGMLAMIPNLAPVVVVLGLMGWLGIHLDYMKLLLATIAIGIAVDDTLHLVIRFRRCFLTSGNYRTALADSMRDVGPALVITTIILLGAFACYLLSQLAIISSFGILLSVAISVALLADMLFMPALLMITKPFGPEFVPASKTSS